MPKNSTDFRVYSSWPSDKKRRRLQRSMGAEGVLALMDLWAYTAEHYPDGVLVDIDAKDLGDAVRYSGDWGELLGELIRLRLVDINEDTISIHDWSDHQPHVSGFSQRSAAGRKAAAARWGKNDAPQDANRIANRMRGACESYAIRNAPSPHPTIQTPHPSSTTDDEQLANVDMSTKRGTGKDVCSISDMTGRLESWGYIVHNVKWKDRKLLQSLLDRGPITDVECESVKPYITSKKDVTSIVSLFLAAVASHRNREKNKDRLAPGEYIPSYARETED